MKKSSGVQYDKPMFVIVRKKFDNIVIRPGMFYGSVLGWLWHIVRLNEDHISKRIRQLEVGRRMERRRPKST